jgi:thymidylate synthase (FAD)
LKIEVLARTVPEWRTLYDYMGDVVELEPQGAEKIVEFAGRACYQSFHKPNAATRLNKDYLANIIAQQHESVLEHAIVSFYVQGVSRNMLLELERHRHLSFSVVSTRFVQSANAQVIVPPALRHSEDDITVPLRAEVRDNYNALVAHLIGEGKTRKQAREAARWELPGNLETKFVVTGNLRAWRDVLKKRYSTHADAEICMFAAQVLRLLKLEAPAVFADFPKQPFE